METGSIAAAYAGSTGVNANQWPLRVTSPKPADTDGFFAGQIKQAGAKGLRSKDISDGLSQSVAVVESVGPWKKSSMFASPMGRRLVRLQTCFTFGEPRGRGAQGSDKRTGRG